MAETELHLTEATITGDTITFECPQCSFKLVWDIRKNRKLSKTHGNTNAQHSGGTYGLSIGKPVVRQAPPPEKDSEALLKELFPNAKLYP